MYDSLGQGRVSYLSNCCGTRFWIHSGNNGETFALLLSSTYTVKIFSAFHPIPPVKRLVALKKLGGHSARTAATN